MPREKNPAAVALGKRRRALMSDAERAAFAAAGPAANKARTLADHKATARKAALSRRLNPPWLKASPARAAMEISSTPANLRTQVSPENGSPATTPAAATSDAAAVRDLAQLAQAIDDLPDDLLEGLFAAIARQIG